ncbi:response regulator [Botrimarina sp.]|uniref:response regulator transcription factor n=1 Tax=Botrimarina sp. TaxID=2795802 RepID=UPI0032EAF4CA
MNDQPLAGKSLLLVDDDELLRERMGRALTARGLEVRVASSGAAALEMARQSPPELAVLDLKMPGMTGLETLAELRKVAPGVRAVILTGYGSIANTVEAMHQGAENYVTKPADADQVLEAFHRSGALSDDEAPPAGEAAIHTPSLAEAEWNHIQQVLADCGGNITRTAERLGIPRRTLQRKLKKLAP